jgi:hypothetical protein
MACKEKKTEERVGCGGSVVTLHLEAHLRIGAKESIKRMVEGPSGRKEKASKPVIYLYT